MSDVAYPSNDFTKMIERTASGNRSGVRGVASATPLPTVQSADMGREVLAPLTAEERAELDLKAIAAGVRDPRIGSPEATDGNYVSLDAAIAAGAPVEIPVERHPVGMAATGRIAAREFIAQTVRLPDFRHVEGIDLLRGCVMVDGMEFSIPETDARDFKQYVVETARAAIMTKLNEAAGLFAAPVTPAEEGSAIEGTTTGQDAGIQRDGARGSAEPTG